MKFGNRRAVFLRKDDIIALDFEGHRHFYPIKHIEFGMLDFQANDGDPIVDGAGPTAPERIDDLVPKYHNVLADVIVGVRPTPVEVQIGILPTVIVQNKSVKVYYHEPEAQPRRYTPFGRNEAFVADHFTSPYDDPDEAWARFWLMHNDEPSLVYENDTGTFDPPALDEITQILRFYFAQYLLGAELGEVPQRFTPIPYLRTTIAEFGAREATVEGWTP